MTDFADNLQTNIPEIDQQHKELFVKIDELINATSTVNIDTLKDMMLFLDSYAAMHFKTEEDLMEQIGYERLEEHKALHQDFIKNKEELETKLTCEGYKNKIAAELRSSLVSWLINHIKIHDMSFADYYHAKFF